MMQGYEAIEMQAYEENEVPTAIDILNPQESNFAPDPPSSLDDAGSLCRTNIWCKIIERTFGHKPLFITAAKNGEAADTIPFFLIHGPLGFKKMVSPPYQGFDGGFSTPDPEIRNRLIRDTLLKAKEVGARYVEIRSLSQLPELPEMGFVETAPLLISTVALTDEKSNWMRLAASHRRNVRMAEKKGVSIEASTSYHDMKIFYSQLSLHYRNLGIPFFGKKFFREIWERLVLNNGGFLLIARYQGENIGGLLALNSGKTLIVKYSVTRHEEKYAHVNASYALYWEAMRRGLTQGFTSLNMGITGEHNQGLREFKIRFGALEKPAHFYYYRIKGSLPDYQKLYGSYQWIKKCWRMIPMGAATVMGDQINRWMC